jgi:hypothetical protein
MSFTLKNGTACWTLGTSVACGSIATSKSDVLSVAISYLPVQTDRKIAGQLPNSCFDRARV